MFIIAGTIDSTPEDIVELMPHLITMMEASNAEAGCLAYSFARDAVVPARLRLFEAWVDDDALRGHFESAHMAAFRAATKDLSLTASDIQRYDVADAGPFTGPREQ